ncbi:hypothetical protein ILUMI_15834 [Ignelater luminosus]|uniref:Uncharacterized protein n=1 Tax=Ignelater luminosus TaxID=2038154 RepID=A0A8K0G3H3_IGNLU|nr:hypothetical protein ILUMI_15834 [Ignelater luminosus]
MSVTRSGKMIRKKEEQGEEQEQVMEGNTNTKEGSDVKEVESGIEIRNVESEQTSVRINENQGLKQDLMQMLTQMNANINKKMDKCQEQKKNIIEIKKNINANLNRRMEEMKEEIKRETKEMFNEPDKNFTKIYNGQVETRIIMQEMVERNNNKMKKIEEKMGDAVINCYVCIIYIKCRENIQYR